MVVKLINNTIGHINVAAFIECIFFGLKAGVDISTLYEMISRNTGSSKQFETRFKDRIMKANYQPGMKLDLVYKDSAIMQKPAGQLSIPIFLVSVAQKVFEIGIVKGVGEIDYSIVMKILDDFRLIKFTPKERRKRWEIE